MIGYLLSLVGNSILQLGDIRADTYNNSPLYYIWSTNYSSSSQPY